MVNRINVIGKFIILVSFLSMLKTVTGQYVGGGYSGASTLHHIWLTCNFFHGGLGQGSASNFKLKDITCNAFYGSEASGSTQFSLPRAIDCSMYTGYSSSGHMMFVLPRSLDCSMYMGDSHSGFYEIFWDNPSNCLMYTSSINAGSGFHSRALSQDTQVCRIIPLGIDCSPLQGQIVGGQGKLFWHTDREHSNSGFEIHRSEDGVTWDRISWISGQGNSESRVQYEYVDKQLSYKEFYYRFKQLDFDGREYWSNIVMLQLGMDDADEELFTLFPNPAISSNVLSLRAWNVLNRPCSVEILSLSGMTLWSMKCHFTASKNQLEIPMNNLSAGSYLLKIRSESDHLEESIPFVIVH